MKTNSKRKKQPTAPSMRSAASRLGVDFEWIREAKGAGVEAFSANGTVRLAPVRAWIVKNRKRLESHSTTPTLRQQYTAEQVRRLRVANNNEAAKLIEKAWVAERMKRVLGELNEIRRKSLEEDSAKFIGSAGDVSRCRMVVREIWDGVMRGIHGCAKHFEE